MSYDRQVLTRPRKRVKVSIDAASDDTHYVYDVVGNATQVFSPSAVAKDASNSSGTPTANTYTFDNLLLSTTVPVSPDGSIRRQTSFGYDQGGAKLSQDVALVNGSGTVTSDAGSQTFSYYSDGRPARQYGRNGELIASRYDPAGNATQITDSTGGGSTLSASYYLDGLERTVDDGARTTKFSYDGAASVAGRSELADSGSVPTHTTTYGFGDAGLPTSMSSDLTGSGQTAWTYDAAGNPAQETDPNGQKLTWSFNPDDTLGSFTLASSGGTTLASWSYTYDGDYRATDQNFSGGGASGGSLVTGDFHYGYDAAGRINSFTNGANPAQSATYDHNGNRLTFGTQSWTYNADSSIASFNNGSGTTTSYTYTPSGNLTGDECSSYSYDGFDRLTQVTAKGATGCSQQSVSYAYDGLDRQRSLTTGGATTTLHYDGLASQVVAETNGSGADSSYELGANGEAKALKDTSGSLQYLTDDGKGNVTTVTGSSGSVLCTARYDPWGSPVGAQPGLPSGPPNPCNTGSTSSDRFYRGERRDPATGQYALGSRTYDPAKASYLTADSYRGGQPGAELGLAMDPLTANRYSYVNGDPVNLVDPDGHMMRCGPDDACYYADRNSGSSSHPRSQQRHSSRRSNHRSGGCGMFSWFCDRGRDIQHGFNRARQAVASWAGDRYDDAGDFAGRAARRGIELAEEGGGDIQRAVTSGARSAVRGLRDFAGYAWGHAKETAADIGLGLAEKYRLFIRRTSKVAAAIWRGAEGRAGAMITSARRTVVGFAEHAEGEAEHFVSHEVRALASIRPGEIDVAAVAETTLNVGKMASRAAFGLSLVAAGAEQYAADKGSHIAGWQDSLRVAVATGTEGLAPWLAGVAAAAGTAALAGVIVAALGVTAPVWLPALAVAAGAAAALFVAYKATDMTNEYFRQHPAVFGSR